MDINKHRQELMKISLNEYPYGTMIYFIIKSELVDDIIKKIKNGKIKSKYFKISNNGYITTDENFINTFYEFIDFFEKAFPPLYYKIRYIIILLDEKVPSFLLKDYYYEDYKITYFINEFKKLCIENFYENIKIIYNDFQSFWKKKKITRRMNLKNDENINKLFQLLQEMVWCNYRASQQDLSLLFTSYRIYVKDYGSNKIKPSKKEEISKDNYISSYETLINNYNNNIESIAKILYKN